MPLKILAYISDFSRELTDDELSQITEVSKINNKKVGITGFLLISKDTFYQILEGEEWEVDKTFNRIQKDARHKNITIIQNEKNVTGLSFSDWSMESFNLQEGDSGLIGPMNTLINQLKLYFGIIGKYTQPTILHVLATGRNPLEMKPRRREKVVMFSDILSFSKISECMTSEEVAAFVNGYLEIVSSIVNRNGGEVDKYIGDCAMVYFAAHQTDLALKSAIEILDEVEKLRKSSSKTNASSVLYTGIGISIGEVFEGNLGSEFKKDFTIIGDTVNIAQRLESLTRTVGRTIVISEGVRNASIANWDFEYLGQKFVKGKTKPLEIFTPVAPIDTTLDLNQIAEEVEKFVQLKSSQSKLVFAQKL